MKPKTLFLSFFAILIASTFIPIMHLLGYKDFYVFMSRYCLLVVALCFMMLFIVYRKHAHTLNELKVSTENNERYKAAFLNYENTLFEYDIYLKQLFLIENNSGDKILLSQNLKEFDTPPCDCLIIEGFLDTFRSMLENADLSKENHFHKLCFTDSDKKETWYKVSLKTLLKDQIPWKIISTVENITKDAHIIKGEKDSLTGLYNRATLEDLVSTALFAKKETSFAFIMIDIDNFKKTNDLYGHFTGDFVLRSIAKTLKLHFSSEKIIARMGGDEFCLFIEHFSSIENVMFKIDKVLEDIALISCGEMPPHSISASFGIAIYPKHGITFQQLYKNADNALYTAKARGKACAYICNTA